MFSLKHNISAFVTHQDGDCYFIVLTVIEIIMYVVGSGGGLHAEILHSSSPPFWINTLFYIGKCQNDNSFSLNIEHRIQLKNALCTLKHNSGEMEVH